MQAGITTPGFPTSRVPHTYVRPRGSPSMNNSTRPLISYAATGISGLVLALIRAPWWLSAGAFACFALGLLVTAIQSVFPQAPEPRLAWWRPRWCHQQRRHNPRLTRQVLRDDRQTPSSRPDAPSQHGE